MNELEVKENIKIENMIYEIRGKEVMLDSDVAHLYNEETRRINEVVKRNISRFPDDFCFRLTKEEIEELRSRSQFAILDNQMSGRGKNLKYLPYVFTEHGIMMLSGLLKSDVAARVNVMIINAFVSMRHYISNNILKDNLIEHKLLEHDKRISLLEKTFDSFKEKNSHIFFEGQIYDAYNLLMEILKGSKKEIIIIDNYAGRELLNLIKNIKVKIKIYSKNIDEVAVKKYKEEYKNIEIINNSSFHDRFIIIDNKTLYHCGASFKDLGKKCFGINKIEDKEILSSILKI